MEKRYHFKVNIVTSLSSQCLTVHYEDSALDMYAALSSVRSKIESEFVSPEVIFIESAIIPELPY